MLSLVGGVWVSAQAPVLPYQPPRGSGDSITGAFEGWFDNDDGSHNFLVGYFNRNLKQPQDVPIGPNNRIEPGGPDLGPADALPAGAPDRRVPGARAEGVRRRPAADLDADRERPDDADSAAAAPRLQRQSVLVTSPSATSRRWCGWREGPDDSGTGGDAERRAGDVRRRSRRRWSLNAWVDDDGKYSSGSNAADSATGARRWSWRWSKYRGPGTITFDAAKPKLEVAKGGNVDQDYSAKATVSARFSEPGDYVLHLLTTDYSGEGGNGEVCCWTNAYVKVSVK